MCRPNKGTLKFCEIKSNKGSLKNDHKSPKLLSRIEIIDSHCHKYSSLSLKGANCSSSDRKIRAYVQKRYG